MIGLNALTRFFRRSIGPLFESTGLLPRRYYLVRAIEALEIDDIDEAVRMISLAANGAGPGAKWRLVCQQIIFRCRVLTALHERRVARIKSELELFGKTEAMRERYLRLEKAETRAGHILQNYERRLLDLLAGHDSSSKQM